MKKIAIALAITAVAVSAVLPSAYAGPPAQEPAGCSDIVAGSHADYSSLYTEATLEEGSLLEEPTIDQREIVPGGLLTVDVQLAADSCPDVAYTLSVYAARPDSRDRLQLLETYSAPGNGSTVMRLETIVNDGPETSPTAAGDPRYCVQVLLSTVDSNGRTIDQAQDTGPVSLCKDDRGSGGFTYGG